MKLSFLLKQLIKNFNNLLYVLLDSKLFDRSIINLKKLNTNNNCLILGNGPSLKEDIKAIPNLGQIPSISIFVVNNFVASPYYEILRPQNYVFADPAFWEENITDDIRILRDNIINQLVIKTKWIVNILVPFKACKNSKTIDRLSENQNIKIYFYNNTGLNKGSKMLLHFFYKNGLASPKQGNVLISTIYLSLNLNFKNIYILGADHSWHESVFVGNDNKLYIKDSHFYSKDASHLVPVKYENGTFLKIHEFFSGNADVFESHILLNEYAESLKAKIFNISSKSYIDAYERLEIDKIEL